MNRLIDHTLLKATATEADIEKLCREAREHSFKSVCVNPCFVKRAKEFLADSGVLVCTVVGFPLGANATSIKVHETEQAVRDGADEIDMVINIGRAKEGDFVYVEKEIAAVVQAAAAGPSKSLSKPAIYPTKKKSRPAKRQRARERLSSRLRRDSGPLELL